MISMQRFAWGQFAGSGVAGNMFTLAHIVATDGSLHALAFSHNRLAMLPRSARPIWLALPNVLPPPRPPPNGSFSGSLGSICVVSGSGSGGVGAGVGCGSVFAGGWPFCHGSWLGGGSGSVSMRSGAGPAAPFFTPASAASLRGHTIRMTASTIAIDARTMTSTGQLRASQPRSWSPRARACIRPVGRGGRTGRFSEIGLYASRAGSACTTMIGAALGAISGT